MLFQCVKDASLTYVGVLHPIIMFIPVAVGSMLIGMLDITNGYKTPAMILEVLFSIIPTHAITLAYLKILYRARFYMDDGIPDTNSWSYSGCRIQL